MNRPTLPALTLALAAVLALAACTTPPVNTANKQFERAWLAFTTLRTDQAMDHFADAAESYAEALDDQSRVALYPSNQVKAGMSFYFSGQFKRCIESMRAAHRVDERIWEADLFSGLAHARLGDREKAMAELALFLKGMPPVRMLYDVAATRIAAMESGADLDRSADLLEEAVQKQMVDIVRQTTSATTVMPVTERCDGPFWWRRNKQPCGSPSGANK